MMDKLIRCKNGVMALLSAVGSMAARACGGWDAALQLLVCLMAADYLTGVLAALVWHTSPKTESGTLNSRAGFRGVCKKGVILLMICVGEMLDRATGAGVFRTMLVLFFAGNEGLSLLENLGLMGVPYPRFLREALDTLRRRGDEGENRS